MRERFPCLVIALSLVVPARAALAAQCYYDSDCAAGTVCRWNACVAPGYQSPASSSQPAAGTPNGAALALGLGLAVVLIVVGLVMLNQQDDDVPQFRWVAQPSPGGTPPLAGGLTVRF